jgi:hypothetical protein
LAAAGLEWVPWEAGGSAEEAAELPLLHGAGWAEARDAEDSRGAGAQEERGVAEAAAHPVAGIPEAGSQAAAGPEGGSQAAARHVAGIPEGGSQAAARPEAGPEAAGPQEADGLQEAGWGPRRASGRKGTVRGAPRWRLRSRRELHSWGM